MKFLKKSNLIIFGVFALAFILFAVLIYQFIILAEKKSNLHALEQRQAELSLEIEQAREKLEIVSSLEYQETEARKKGYAYPDEKRFIGVVY